MGWPLACICLAIPIQACIKQYGECTLGKDEECCFGSSGYHATCVGTPVGNQCLDTLCSNEGQRCSPGKWQRPCCHDMTCQSDSVMGGKCVSADTSASMAIQACIKQYGECTLGKDEECCFGSSG